MYEVANNLKKFGEEDESVVENENSATITKSKCLKCGNEECTFQNLKKDKIRYNCPNCGIYEY